MVKQLASNFFILEDGKVVSVNPKVLLVPEFMRLWSRDKTKNKAKVRKEFAFIYFIADFESEYNAYGLEKEEQVAEDIFGDRKYTPDDLIMEAIGKYETLQKTHSMRMLLSVRKQADRYIRHNETLAMNVEGYDPKAAMASMKGFEEIMEQLEKWERKVYHEEDEMIIRGGGKVGLFEDKDTAEWMNLKQ